jgi:hypothetical protein
MAKTRKRREQKRFAPQPVKAGKASTAKKRNVNWIQVAAIAIGVLIVLSMILSLFIFPGTGSAF